jgi:hypothetical protein
LNNGYGNLKELNHYGHTVQNVPLSALHIYIERNLLILIEIKVSAQ